MVKTRKLKKPKRKMVKKYTKKNKKLLKLKGGTNAEKQFQNACENGNLEEAKMLLQNNPSIDISANNENAFKLACQNGHLEVLKWLLEVKPNINISNDNVFQFACYHGQLEVAKWLLEVKPNINISADNEFAFRWACRNGHLAVAQWLRSLKPLAYNVKNCTINTEKNQKMTGLLYSINKSGNENALTADVVEGLNEYIR